MRQKYKFFNCVLGCIMVLCSFGSCKKIQMRKWPISEFTFNGKTYYTNKGEQRYRPGYIHGNGNMGVYSYGYEAEYKEKGISINLWTNDSPEFFKPGTYSTRYYSQTFPAYSEGSIFTLVFTENGKYYRFTSINNSIFNVTNNEKGYPELSSDEMMFEIKSTNDPDIDTTIFYKIKFIIRTHMENPY